MLIDDIRKAAELRLRKVTVKIGGKPFVLSCKVFSVAEFSKMNFSESTEAAAALVAENFFDPNTGDKVFTPSDVLALPQPDAMALVMAFVDANNGGGDEKN